jgi:hypothetical protein
MSSNKKSSRSKTVKNRYADCPDATTHGLHHWFKHMFEELGWMVLAKDYGMTDKVAVYKHSIERLKCALETKIKNVHDSDKKEDLAIMLHNVLILSDHVKKDFS